MSSWILLLLVSGWVSISFSERVLNLTLPENLKKSGKEELLLPGNYGGNLFGTIFGGLNNQLFFFCEFDNWFWRGGSFFGDTLPETNSKKPLKIGPNCRRKLHLPAIDFQGRWLLVSSTVQHQCWFSPSFFLGRSMNETTLFWETCTTTVQNAWNQI